MKVGLIGSEMGIHEERFLRMFRDRGAEVTFISFEQLIKIDCSAGNVETENGFDLFFGGPLHHGLDIASSISKVPYVAVSYAFDVLQEAAVNAEAAASVRSMLDLCDGLLVDCKAVIQCARENFRFKGPAIVRPWGLDEFNRSSSGSLKSHSFSRLGSDSEVWVASMRNFTMTHGVLDVVRAFGEAANQNERLRLLMVGDGPLRGEVHDMINRLGLSERVKILGKVSEGEISHLLEQVDIYVSASIVDGTSISLLQALAAGLPVLLSDVGGNPEWVDRCEGAYLFESGNEHHLAKLILDEADRESLCPYDRSQILEEYADWNQNADDIFEFCQQVIREQKISHQSAI